MWEIALTHKKHSLDKYTYRKKVYTREEADSLGIKYLENWKLATEGQWLLTTDGFVLECLKKGAWWMRTCIGTFATNTKNAVCETQAERYGVPTRYEYPYQVSHKPHWSIDVAKTKCSPKEITLAQNVVLCFYLQKETPLREAFKRTYPYTYAAHKYKEYCDIWAYNMLYRPHVQREIGRIMGNVKRAKGLTDEYFVDQAQKLYKMAFEKGDYKEALRILEFMRKQSFADLVPLGGDLSEEEKTKIDEERRQELKKREQEIEQGEEENAVQEEGECSLPQEGRQMDGETEM